MKGVHSKKNREIERTTSAPIHFSPSTTIQQSKMENLFRGRLSFILYLEEHTNIL